ncbi:DNA replication complex GINS protein PSF2 [Aphelenchoides besseyi]|nr:DNA replication complex GINS protein PSF2 [Aphelenchoides besseyi]KAI6207393.1 DNA replication complex GINS protein PSF2 [Aphelenchoides besseyi]
MDFEDCDFLAEDEPVTIIPNFTGDPIELFVGSFGPFKAGFPLTVPLWFGMYLKRRHKCKIVNPDWLNMDDLKRMIVHEDDIPTLSKVPKHYFEIAHMVLTKACDDIFEADQLMTLVTDLKDKRESKMRTSIQKFTSQSDTCYAVLNNLTRFEAAHFRPFLEAALSSVDCLNENRYIR